MDIQTLLDHYVNLAKHPGWKAYAWQRVQELAKVPEWRELPTLLTEAMRNDPKAINPPANRTRPK